MLRKTTSFFDPALQNLGNNHLESWRKIDEIRNLVVRLVEDISIIRIFEQDSEMLRLQRFSQRFKPIQELLSGITFGQPGQPDEFASMCSELCEECEKVHRLECVFTYPWEEDAGKDKHRLERRVTLNINFFEKNSRKWYYRLVFRCNNFHDQVELLELD